MSENSENEVEPKTKIESMLVRLENELDALINMFAFARKALENEMLSGVGYKQVGLNEAVAKKLKELTQGMSSAVECKVRYDKAKKELAKNMTPDEEMGAVVAYIVNLTTEERHKLRERLNTRGVFKWNS